MSETTQGARIACGALLFATKLESGAPSRWPHIIVLAVAILRASYALAEEGRALWNGDVPLATAPRDQGETFISTRGLTIVTDGEGGAIVAWEDDYGGNVSAQRVDADGSPRWAGGAPSGLVVAPGPCLQWLPEAVSDGAGGAVIAWIDARNGSCALSLDRDVFAQRLDPLGRPIWSAEGVPVATDHDNHGKRGIALAPDGTGGAILAWYGAGNYPTYGIYAQHIDGNAQVLWGGDGVLVARASSSGKVWLVSDGSGGAIVAFSSTDYPADSIRVQRIRPDGTLLWDPAGIEVGRVGFDASIDLAEDKEGGAIIAYATFREDVLRIFAQRVNASGDLLWPGGRAVTSVPTFQNGPQVVSDDEGGAIIVWQEGIRCRRTEDDCDVFAQRLSSDGELLWELTGVPISAGPADEHAPRLAEDGEGGAIVVWNDCRHHPVSCPLEDTDLFAQRVNANGQPLWTDGGIPVSVAAANQGLLNGASELPSSVAVVADGAHGAILAWPDGRKTGLCRIGTVGSDCDVYAQRVPEPSNDLLRSVALGVLAAVGVLNAALRKGHQAREVT